MVGQAVTNMLGTITGIDMGDRVGKLDLVDMVGMVAVDMDTAGAML